MTWKKYLNGLFSGKCLSILIFLSSLKKLYFQEKLLKHLILQSFQWYSSSSYHCSTHKHLGINLDEKLNFGHHITEKIAKTNKDIGVIKKLHNFLSHRVLLTIYKFFIRRNLDHVDFIYDQPNNDSFCSKIESVQYNAALAVTGAIQGTSQTKLKRELGLGSLRSRLWFRHLCKLYKIKATGLPLHLNNYVTKSNTSLSNTKFWVLGYIPK